MDVAFATIDIEGDAALERQYGELIPVILHEGQEIARAPLNEKTLRRALAKAGLSLERR
jgi:hypothetical protein